MTARLLFLIVAALITTTSFHPAGEVATNQGSFHATLDGKVFKLRSSELYRGILMSKPGSMDGRIPARTVIAAKFNGPQDAGTGEQIFTESIQFEMDYMAGKTGAVPNYGIMLKYDLATYVLVREQSKLSLTSFSRSPDGKYFYISADFDCQMRSINHPDDGKRDIALKGRMSNIRITIPASLAKL